MIVKIEKPVSTCLTALSYNEKKVIAGEADVVCYANLQDCTSEVLYGTFDRYEKGAVTTVREVCFHASVNPSETDTCSEEKIVSFISGLMNELGYGQQPWIVYKHHDIEREHYHVVSVRIDKSGHKISSRQERRRATRYMESVCEQYGFSMALRGRGVRSADNLSEDKDDRHRYVEVPHFDPSGSVASQLREIFSAALTYDFESPQQLGFVLETLGVRAEIVSSGKGPQFILQGLDRKGKTVTASFTEEMLQTPLYSNCMNAAVENRQRHHLRLREKERVRGLADAAFKYSRSEQHFKNILKNHDIDVIFSRNDEGLLYGLTFIDSRTRSVFKASELNGAVSVVSVQLAISSGRWREEERGGRRGDSIRMARERARKDSVALRDIKVGAVARLITPVSQPKGNSWNGKSEMSDEQKAAERDQLRTGMLNSSLEDDRFIDYID